MRKLFIVFFFLHLTLSANDLENPLWEQELHAFAQETLFVSLGSFCEAAHMFKFCGIRKAAFPFDWITTFDGEALIEILQDDFRYFLDEAYLKPYDFGGALLHHYYHMEFLHEGDWRGDRYYQNMSVMKPKYQRRIERFRQLKDYKGKIIFIRTAFIYSMNDPHRFFRNQDNLEITPTFANRLYNTLLDLFPDLDFKLIIVNIHDRVEFEQEPTIHDNILMFRANPMLEINLKIDKYRDFFKKLSHI